MADLYLCCVVLKRRDGEITGNVHLSIGDNPEDELNETEERARKDEPGGENLGLVWRGVQLVPKERLEIVATDVLGWRAPDKS
jgi:hypothetical protein